MYLLVLIKFIIQLPKHGMTNTKFPVTSFIVKNKNFMKKLQAVSNTMPADGLTDLPIKILAPELFF